MVENGTLLLWPLIARYLITLNDVVLGHTKEHKLKNRANVLGQDLFEMHSKTEGTSLLWRSIVDFLFEKGISIPRITTKIQTPCNTNFLWMKNSTPFQTIIFDSVFYFISILSFVILFYKVLSQNIWPFFRFMLFCPKTTSLSVRFPISVLVCFEFKFPKTECRTPSSSFSFQYQLPCTAIVGGAW